MALYLRSPGRPHTYLVIHGFQPEIRVIFGSCFQNYAFFGPYLLLSYLKQLLHLLFLVTVSYLISCDLSSVFIINLNIAADLCIQFKVVFRQIHIPITCPYYVSQLSSHSARALPGHSHFYVRFAHGELPGN